ncbi:hypothetical protein ABFS82_03G012300 [Erythranthe guttata]
MEEMTSSSSSSSEGNKVNESGGDNHSLFVTNPCNYFQQFIRAVLKCLGFETTASTQGGSSSSSPQQPAEPPPTDGDPPPSDPTAAVMAARIGRRPPKPIISGGPGPQTNANPST